MAVEGTAFGIADLNGLVNANVAWSNRNRLTEDSQVLFWDGADVTPEVGQTTTIQALDMSKVLINEVTGLAGRLMSKDQLSPTLILRSLATGELPLFESAMSVLSGYEIGHTASCTLSFDAAAHDIETETSVRLVKAQVKQIVCDAAQDFDAFYAQPCSADLQQVAQSKPIQVLTFDGKGVVMRPEALREATRKKAEVRASQAPRGFARKEKSNRRRMAAVASLYHIDRHRRSAQTVARRFAPLRLVPTERQAAPKPVGKKLWASLEKSMKTVIETTFAEALRRDPDQQAEWVALVDGDPTQIDSIEKAAKAHGVEVVIILDIIHVLEYLWKAAKVRFAPDDPQAAPWVAEQIERLLHGQVRTIVRGLRRWATVQKLSSSQREPIDHCTTYLSNHVPYLNYPDYLAKGYPIATGVIEGACRYLVKDRMEITGARWGLEGGEAVLKLRALVINGDFEAYWVFHETQEYHRNHQAKFAENPSARAPLKLVAGGKTG